MGVLNSDQRKKKTFINALLPHINNMIFEQNKSIENTGEKIGYLFSYILFTTIVFFIFSFLNKLPSNWSFFHITGVTLLIAIIGIIIKRVL